MGTLQWLQLVMGTTFVLAGLIAWRVRPGNRTGPIMALYGSMVVGGWLLQRADVPVVVTLGLLVADSTAFVFMYLLLAFPSGRLSSRADWLILGPVLVVFGPLELLWLAFFDVPDNVLLIRPDAELATRSTGSSGSCSWAWPSRWSRCSCGAGCAPVRRCAVRWPRCSPARSR
jgi:hypothetical protein